MAGIYFPTVPSLIRDWAFGTGSNYIRNHYQQDIGIGDVARHVGMSRAGLSKAFRTSLQKMPGAILRHRRLEQGKRLLGTTDLKLEAVAIESGFRDASRLCRIFHRETGLSPTAYRRNMMNKMDSTR